MQSFETLSKQFAEKFDTRHFPVQTASLYDPNEYFLKLGGKRIRPVLCLMGNELFDDIIPDSWHVATAIELFHNFTLIHDDIMDKAPLRRGKQTVHTKYNDSTALLAGDVMMVRAYEYLNKISSGYLSKVLSLFNRTAIEVCEGQQMDMDFETRDSVSMEEYLPNEPVPHQNICFLIAMPTHRLYNPYRPLRSFPPYLQCLRLSGFSIHLYESGIPANESVKRFSYWQEYPRQPVSLFFLSFPNASR